MATMRTAFVKFIRKGDNSVNVLLSQDSILHKKSIYVATYIISVNVTDGTDKALSTQFNLRFVNTPPDVQISGGILMTTRMVLMFLSLRVRMSILLLR